MSPSRLGPTSKPRARAEETHLGDLAGGRILWVVEEVQQYCSTRYEPVTAVQLCVCSHGKRYSIIMPVVDDFFKLEGFEMFGVGCMSRVMG